MVNQALNERNLFGMCCTWSEQTLFKNVTKSCRKSDFGRVVGVARVGCDHLPHLVVEVVIAIAVALAIALAGKGEAPDARVVHGDDGRRRRRGVGGADADQGRGRRQIYGGAGGGGGQRQSSKKVTRTNIVPM